MTAAALPASIPPSERIPVLDVVRGVALLGILIMNMPAFSTSFFAGADGSLLWPGRVDRLTELGRELLLSGKFNSMFSLLFGLGFTIQYARLQAADPAHATGIYLRRLLVLGAIGLVHFTVFWGGDILHVYALLGLVLVLGLRHVGDRGIVALMVLCLLYPAVSGLLRILVMTPDIVAERIALAQAMEASDNLAYGSGSFWQAAGQHMREFAFLYGDRWSLWSTFGFYVQVTLTMLLGLLAGRRRWAERIPELMPAVLRLHWRALALGLACGVVYALISETQHAAGPTPLKLLAGVCYWLGRVSMMVFYVLTIARLMQLPTWQRRLQLLFGAAGRMPLTNYLMQTAICTTIFYGWGFGLWGRVGPAMLLAAAPVIFFGVQVPFSLWWLRSHRQGPLEWVWARLTYGRASKAASPVTAARP